MRQLLLNVRLIEHTWSGEKFNDARWKNANSINKFEIKYKKYNNIQYLEIDYENKLWKISGLAENGKEYEFEWEIIAWEVLD